MDWIELDGVGLRYDIRPGGEVPLVLLHEMGGTLESWDGIWPLLDPALRVLRLDWRGAGLSTKARSPLRIDDLVGDVLALLDALGWHGPVAVAGCAVGGAIATRLAARHPARVRALVAMGPALGVPPERRLATIGRGEAIARGGTAAVVEEEMGRCYPPALRGDAGRYRRFRARWLANDPDSFAAIYRMLAELEMQDDLPAIACPTLLLAGELDPLRPPAMIEPLAARIVGARFQALPSGHFMAVQTPEPVAEAINAFLLRS